MNSDNNDHEHGLDEPIPIVIDGTLDLHHFSPKDFGRLIPDYLEQCHLHGIYQVRLIHGKGKGILRRTVHQVLHRLPLVHSFRLADETAGSWGATLVFLERLPKNER
jgi:DNA-nicking Smr family endonuclease